MTLNRILLFSIAVFLLGCSRQERQADSPAPVTRSKIAESRSYTAARSTSDAFDFYLLTLSWSPEYCHSHSSAAECTQHAAFVLHGLWPERSDGTYPQNCSNAPGPSDPGAYSGLYPDSGLLQHEWKTHGTCSGLSPDAYFDSVREAYGSIKTPPSLTKLTSPTALPPDQIIAQFQAINTDLPASSVVVSCGNNYLTAVEVCLDKNLQPTSCGAVKTCHANSVRILNP